MNCESLCYTLGNLLFDSTRHAMLQNGAIKAILRNFAKVGIAALKGDMEYEPYFQDEKLHILLNANEIKSAVSNANLTKYEKYFVGAALAVLEDIADATASSDSGWWEYMVNDDELLPLICHWCVCMVGEHQEHDCEVKLMEYDAEAISRWWDIVDAIFVMDGA